MDETKLSKRQKLFIEFFVETGNKTEAAKFAGYKNPQLSGGKTYDKLKPFIDARLAANEAKRIATQEEVLRYFTSVMRNEIKEHVVVVENIGDRQSEARLVEKDVSIKDRTNAAGSLAKRYGLFSNKSGNISISTADEWVAALTEEVNGQN